MNIGVLNEKQGIMVTDSLDDLGYLHIKLIKKQMPEGANLGDLAFLYMPDKDWIIMNKKHALYEFYSEIIPIYLELSKESRKKCVAEAPTDTIKRAFYILDDAICYRTFLSSLAV